MVKFYVRRILVSTYGRLQSRRYKKTCKDGRVVEKVTYELSIKGIVGV